MESTELLYYGLGIMNGITLSAAALTVYFTYKTIKSSREVDRICKEMEEGMRAERERYFGKSDLEDEVQE